MRIKNFVDIVCDELQFDDLEFKKKIMRDLLPSAEKKILSITSVGNIFRFNCKAKKIEDGKLFFYLPDNIHNIKTCKLNDTDIFPVENLSDLEAGRYEYLEQYMNTEYSHPLFLNNIYSVNIKNSRMTTPVGLKYTFEALDYTAFMNAADPKQITDYYYEIGFIYDNENIFYKTAELKEYSPIRIKTITNTYQQPDDCLEIMTDFGEFVINIYDQNQYFYLGEDGTTYTDISNAFALSGLIVRSKTWFRRRLLITPSEVVTDILNLEYYGTTFPHYNLEENNSILDTYNEYVKFYVFYQGARYFGIREKIPQYKRDLDEITVGLMRDSSFQKGKNKSITFKPARLFGRHPRRR